MAETIMLEVTSETAAGLRGALPDSEGVSAAAPLAALLRDLGLEIQAVHPSAVDDDIGRYFMVSVEIDPDLASVLERIQRCPGVSSAYVEAPGEEPGDWQGPP